MFIENNNKKSESKNLIKKPNILDRVQGLFPTSPTPSPRSRAISKQIYFVLLRWLTSFKFNWDKNILYVVCTIKQNKVFSYVGS